MYKICKHCKEEIIPASKTVVVIVKSGNIVMGIHTPEGIFLEDKTLEENYYHTECYQLKEGKQMNSRKAQPAVDQELDRRKARAWDELYEWATGRTLVHVSVDLDDMEKRMDELLAQENAEHEETLVRTNKRIYTQEELAYIFYNYVPVTEYPTGDKIYLPKGVLDELQAEGVLSWDDDPPAQWGFNKEDRKKIEAALLGYKGNK